MSDAPSDNSAPFEGPEKLLEVWFAPTAADVPDAPKTGSMTTGDERYGLRKVSRGTWEEMLDIVQCKVLSVIHGREMDAYLLSESSLFISPHRLILKTCGTTLNLLGLPRILAIARDQAGLPDVHRCFYSRKSFMFPERQLGPHREWKDEVRYLDDIFGGASSVGVSPTPPSSPSPLDTADHGIKATGNYGVGGAYTVGKVNGDHWLLYLTSPNEAETVVVEEEQTPVPTTSAAPIVDYTIEILMSDLAPEARAPFTPTPGIFDVGGESSETPSSHAQTLSRELGISGLFPERSTTLDAYTFSPCGYSANALLRWGDEDHGGEGYYTIHVTPEEGWSYASFECNVPLPHTASTVESAEEAFPDFELLIQRVVSIFKPGRLTLTLFVSSEDGVGENESAVDAAQKTFVAALAASQRKYKRTDKINYEFGGYDLAFASFELRR